VKVVFVELFAFKGFLMLFLTVGNKKLHFSQFFLGCIVSWLAGVGKDTFKNNGDEALSDAFFYKVMPMKH
jgi:hypothetical protein